MKRNQPRKLTLARETVVQLNPNELARIAAGLPTESKGTGCSIVECATFPTF